MTVYAVSDTLNKSEGSVHGEKAGSSRRSRRWRAIGLDILTTIASMSITYVNTRLRGDVQDVEQFIDLLPRGITLSVLFIVVRRFAHAKRRGNVKQYDYIRMNPQGKQDTIDFISPVPYIDWERHRDQTAFFDNIIDHARFIDTPGLALHTVYKGTPDEVLETLATFRAAAFTWDLETTKQGGYTVHAIFDIPPPLTNQWTSDHGARMWLSVNAGDTSGYSDVRVVFGVGGFGQGQPASVITALVPENWLPVEFLDGALKVEADLRGAVSWWILVGRALGLADEEFSDLRSGRLAEKVFTGRAQSVFTRRIGKVVLWTIAAFITIVFIVPILYVVLSDVVQFIVSG